MQKPKIMGIGCFAKPETLDRVLKRVLEHFIPEERNQSGSLGSQPGERRSLSRMLGDILAPPTDGNISGRLRDMECKHIIGFFVWIKDCRLVISMFIRDDWRDRYMFTARVNGSWALEDGCLRRGSIPARGPLFRTFEQTVQNAQGMRRCPERGNTDFATNGWAFGCNAATPRGTYSCTTPLDGSRCTSQDRSGAAFAAKT
jgi:hypothetical protein